MDIHEYITYHLDKYDFDIRKSGYARFSDQKCTPDIVSFVADCIVNISTVCPIFTIKDIWQSQYFIRNTRAFFNKPWANDERAKHEYDKVIAQPLNLLAYAHIIKEVKGQSRQKSYIVEDELLLDYVSRRDHNAYEFLLQYFTKVLEDSGFMKYFREYLTAYKINVGVARSELYRRFHIMLDGNTPTHSELDTKRIFHKIFNVLACANCVPGSKGSHNIMFSDLMYNRTNMRDLNKPKEMSRQEYKVITSNNSEDEERNSIINEYYVRKTLNQVRKIELCSEVHDSWGLGEATQVHHIFPKHDYPILSATVENLIKLTATQHYTKAHPKNNTQQVCADYQRVCLLSKADTIKASIQKNGESFYRKVSFINVINEGYNLDLSTKLDFNQIKEEINKQYRIIVSSSYFPKMVADISSSMINGHSDCPK